MVSDDLPSLLTVSSTPDYVMSAQEQLFAKHVITPQIRAKLADLRGVVEEDLTKAFAAVRSDLNHKVAKMRELLKVQALLLQSKFLTHVDDKMASFLSASPLSSRSEPPPLDDVVFSGEPQHLDSFLYSIYDALAAHLSAFVDNGLRIQWISGHLKPVGSPAAHWWPSLVAETASLFDGAIPPGRTAAYLFCLKSLLTVDSFLNNLVKNFTDPFAAQKSLKLLQEFTMGKLGVQQFNVKSNSLTYCVSQTLL